ncbi:MAG: glycosyltransferase family 4 protein [Verrucomicrobiota bacterium]
MLSGGWQSFPPALREFVLAYLFERFPKFSQTFCYREVAEMWRQGERPAIFSLRAADLGAEVEWMEEIVREVQYLPEGDRFAQLADAAGAELNSEARAVLRAWKGKPDSLRLHQAVYLGARLRRLGVQHLHAHFAGMAARTAYWVREFYGLPFSVTVHANDIFAPEKFEIGLRQIMGSAKLVITVSDFAAAHLRRLFPSARIARVYNGIEVEAFPPARAAQPSLLLGVGRLIPKKGWDVLIGACALLRKTEPAFRCEIIGDGPLRDKLQRQIEDLQLRDVVELAGPQSQRTIRDRLRAASMFVLPARIDADGGMDNLPTVIMEAMAAGLPVVSTSVGGIPEMVIDRQNGILIPPDDPPAAAAAMIRLLHDPELGQCMGEEGRARAREHFAIEKCVASLRALLRRDD